MPLSSVLNFGLPLAWLVIVRLEKLIPARLDEQRRAQLLNNLFEAWLNEQIHKLDALSLHNTPKALVSL